MIRREKDYLIHVAETPEALAQLTTDSQQNAWIVRGGPVAAGSVIPSKIVGQPPQVSPCLMQAMALPAHPVDVLLDFFEEDVQVVGFLAKSGMDLTHLLAMLAERKKREETDNGSTN